MRTITKPTSTRSGSDVTELLYGPSWFLAAALTGIVAGFMLGHALILARFVDWLLLAGAPALSQAYPAFRATAGRPGLDAFYAVAGLQLVGTSAFLLGALMAGRQPAAGRRGWWRAWPAPSGLLSTTRRDSARSRQAWCGARRRRRARSSVGSSTGTRRFTSFTPRH